MLGIIAFISTCLLWQSLKNAWRGPRKPRVSLRTTPRIVTECGCAIEGKRVAELCAAHRAMLESD